MKRMLCIALGLIFVAAVSAQTPPAPDEKKKDEPAKTEAKKDEAKKDDAGKAGDLSAVDVLKKADAATKKVESVRYAAKFAGIGDAEAVVPKIKGTGVMGGKKTEEGPQKFRYEVKLTMPGGGDERELTVGSDGDDYFLIDPATKTVFEDIDPGVLGQSGALVMRLFAFAEYGHPRPFSDEINGEKQELRGTKEVGGEKCHVVYVKYAGGQGESVWFFSTKDFMPRRVERIRTQQGKEITTALEITELSIDPKFTDNPFKAVVPEGFKKSDR